MEKASSDAMAVLFFLKDEKEKNGGAKGPMRASAPTGKLGTSVESMEKERREAPLFFCRI